MKKLSSLSVFFPVFNEEQNIRIFVKEALKIIPTVAKRFEIIIVNDGSTDQSKQIAKALGKMNPQIKVVSHAKNLGYGAALKTGFKTSRYQWIFFTDGDLQFDLGQLKDLVQYTDEYQVVIGYRKKRAEGKLRAFNASLFKLYIDLLFRVHVRDIDCAFKLMKADLIHSIPLVSDGAFTTSELLYKMKKRGIRFKQVSVTHHPRKFGKSTGNDLKVIVKAGLEALSLYLQIKFGLRRISHS